MVPLSELQYARKYPFSGIARRVVKQLSTDISTLDARAFESALEWVRVSSVSAQKERRAFVERHVSKRELSYPEFLEQDILSFPLSKILLSCVGNPLLYDRFAQLMGDLTFDYLMSEKDKLASLLELAQDLEIRMDVDTSGGQLTILIPFTVFLGIPFHDAQLHLVNQPVQGGLVCLEVNMACRWMAERVHALVFASLPVDVKGLPPIFSEMTKVARSRIQMQYVHESKSLAQNGVVVHAFPPCMEKMYGEITSGVNLSHMARFDLATFLVNIDMPHEDIVGVFSKASNYDERITRYHVGNLSGKTSGKRYSSPACAKVREHGLCVSRTCNVMHPLQFYRRELSASSEKESVFPNKNAD